MTEDKWRNGTDPAPMLEFVRGTASDRKFRLLAAAACRRVLHLAADDRPRAAVTAAESFADGEITEEARREAEARARAAFEEEDNRYDNRLYSGTHPKGDEGVAKGWSLLAVRDLTLACAQALKPAGFRAADLALQAANSAEKGAMRAIRLATGKGQTPGVESVWSENRSQVELIHCVIGNPFRPAVADAGWLTSTVVALATGLYAGRGFDRMPILADALEDAGCDHVDILSHCRSEAPHARGCWAVDLLLGKK